MTGYAKSRPWIEERCVIHLIAETRTENDAVLMEQLCRGEMSALGPLYKRYGKMVAHAVVAVAPSLSAQDVEDITQDIFIVVAKSAGRYQDKGKLRSWLYSVAVRTARKRYRAEWLHRRLLGAAQGRPVAVSGGTSSPEAKTLSRVDLSRAFKGLSKTQRQVLVLFEVEGLSGEEVSEMLSIRLNTVWSHLRRARNRVQASIDGPQGAGR
jgi:RNA polymerase sigma-70 factor, ECF subfamily